MTVPCNHCQECLRSAQTDIVSRLSEELPCWQNKAIFFTLTYDEENVPLRYILSTEKCGIVLTDERPEGVEILDFFPPLDVVKRLSDKQLRQRREDISFRFLSTLSPDESEDIPVEFCPGMDFGRIHCAVSFRTVCKSDIRRWLKYCRKVFDRHNIPCEWRLPSGCIEPRPSHIGKSFRYFITSEYGPITFRPHYHGVLFGITENVFVDIFAKNWKFGKVDYSVFDPSRGGFTYISKYCCKGQYDNFLSTRYYNYPNGKYYFSNHYEYSLRWFHVDAPLCDKTFRLQSNGLGSIYLYKKSSLSYWHVFALREECLYRSKPSFRYIYQDDFVVGAPKMSTFGDKLNSNCVCIPPGPFETLTKILTFDRASGSIVNIGFISPEENILQTLNLSKQRYVRFYFKKKRSYAAPVSSGSIRRHLYCSGPPQVEAAVSISFLPRYYRSFMFSAARQSALLDASRMFSDTDYKASRPRLRSESFRDEIFSQILVSEAIRDQLRFENVWRSFARDFTRSKSEVVCYESRFFDS